MDKLLITTLTFFSVGLLSGLWVENTFEKERIEAVVTPRYKSILARVSIPVSGVLAFAGQEGASFTLGYTIGALSNFVYHRLTSQERK